MSEKRYVIEFSGQIIPGWEIEEVKANMANLLKADDSKIPLPYFPENEWEGKPAAPPRKYHNKSYAELPR